MNKQVQLERFDIQVHACDMYVKSVSLFLDKAVPTPAKQSAFASARKFVVYVKVLGAATTSPGGLKVLPGAVSCIPAMAVLTVVTQPGQLV